jgi:hypothetical protein
MSDQDKKDILNIFSESPIEIQKIVSSVIDAEHLKIHQKKVHGIKEQISDIIREVIK